MFVLKLEDLKDFWKKVIRDWNENKKNVQSFTSENCL